MALRSPTRRQTCRLAALLGLAVVLLAAPGWVRLTVHFSASFNLPSAPGGAMIAEVGSITNLAPPEEFQIVVDPAGGGQISVSDAGTGNQPALLVCGFEQIWKGGQLTASWQISQQQEGGSLIFRFADDSDAGMIDVGCDGNGGIFVGDQFAGPLPTGTELDLVLILKDPLIGPATWTLIAKPTVKAATAGDGGSAGWVAGGSLPKGLVLASLQLIRPADSPAASFTVDEIRAVSGSSAVKF